MLFYLDINKSKKVVFEKFSNTEYIYFIAEIGINHNGDMSIAKELIDIASESGCDAVKFQKRDIDTVYSKEVLNSPRKSPWGDTQYDQKKGLEFNIEEYKEIDDYCKLKKIDWFASSWDCISQRQMRIFNFKFNKVASAMATNIEFLKTVAEEKIPTFLSTGMTNLIDIENAIKVFRDYDCELMLFHTVSTYPASEEDLNLSCINTLKTKFNLNIGYSGHESSVSPSIIAASLGASVIERHITLDRAMYGSDQAASLQKEGLKQLVSVIRKLPKVFGNGEKIFNPKEKPIAQKLRYWES